MRRMLALLATLTALAAFAIEPPKPAGSPATPPAQAEPRPAEKPAPEEPAPAAGEPAGQETGEAAGKPAGPAGAKDDEELPPLPPDTVPSGPPPQRFTPSEKVRADFPVSFPIDI